MYKLWFSMFVIGVILGYSSLLISNSNRIEKGKVLSLENAKDGIIPTSFPTTNPTDTPTSTPISTPIPTPISSPKPTIPPTPIVTQIPTPTPVIIPPSDLIPLFDEFSITYSVDKGKLIKIADCESHFNRGVWAPPYAGMYQFHEKTWEKYRKMMGKDSNIDLRFGARESIETAAFVLSIGAQNIWPVCSR